MPRRHDHHASDQAAFDLAGGVLLRTEHELVVDKPAGLPSEARSSSARSVLRAVFDAGHTEARLPHRLDAVTSGVLVVALDRLSAAWHGEQIAGRAWCKLYIARVPAEAAPGLVGDHVVHLKRAGRMARVVRSGGDRAETRVLAVAGDPVNRRSAQALIEITTGRFHQIRVTMAHLGAPLIGDTAYGGPSGELLLDHAALRMTPAESREVVWVRSARSRDRLGPFAPELSELLDEISDAS
ncbi:MAG: RNA pseudouridine synthase [Okeania sp. SIO3B3]|nr:RNA pseudouridine synthase [Okeania sp. SIO3B3]